MPPIGITKEIASLHLVQLSDEPVPVPTRGLLALGREQVLVPI